MTTESMAELELAFVGRFSAACQIQDRHLLVNDVMGKVGPDMLTDRKLGALYDLLRVRFSQGEPTDASAMVPEINHAGIPIELVGEMVDESTTSSRLEWYAERIVAGDRARRQLDLLRLATQEAESACEAGGKGARQIAERLSMRLLSLHGEDGPGQAACLAEMLVDERAAMDREADVEIPVPYPALNRIFGPLVPGDLIGLSAFSGGGKSTVAANLALGWLLRGVPVLAFPTEMRQRWVARLTAIASNTRQWVAEKRQWHRATDAERDAYRTATYRIADLPLEVVNEPNISVPEILTRVRILRRQWSGRPVVVIIDHMHRLDYGGEEPNKVVGLATKQIKNFAGSDSDGGLVFVCLYQPRKPMGVATAHRPVAAAEIRGDSMVWNELDVHLSPFRMRVRTSAFGATAWGTPACLLDAAGRPVAAKPKELEAKIDDEHTYFTVDKRRIGGDYGKIVVLDFDYPAGRLYERAEEPVGRRALGAA